MIIGHWPCDMANQWIHHVRLPGQWCWCHTPRPSCPHDRQICWTPAMSNNNHEPWKILIIFFKSWIFSLLYVCFITENTKCMHPVNLSLDDSMILFVFCFLKQFLRLWICIMRIICSLQKRTYHLVVVSTFKSWYEAVNWNFAARLLTRCNLFQTLPMIDNVPVAANESLRMYWFFDWFSIFLRCSSSL